MRDSVESTVGAGGWGYFPGGLPAYSRIFRFVEVNATFYSVPSPEAVRRWRATVPPSFRFSVKARGTIGHQERLRPSARAVRAWADTVRVARELRADHVVIQVPEALEVDAGRIRGLADLLGTESRPRFVGLEAKAWHRDPPPPSAVVALERAGIADVADLSLRPPATSGDEAYVRLFGPGQGNRWQFDSRELVALSRATEATEVDRMFFAFHGVRMYSDAARFDAIRQGRTPPPVSRGVGPASIEAVLAEDARFPSSRDALIADQGWKVYDARDGETEHVDVALRRLPPGLYRDTREVASAVARLANSKGEARGEIM